MNCSNIATGKERLVVEVVATHNLMPKDGEGSSSPFVEVEFENQRLRTQVKLNSIWNEKLVFDIQNVADIPYRSIEVNIFNEMRSSNSCNFLATSPNLGGDSLNRDKTSSTYDLVEQVQYLYVRLMKAKDISFFCGCEIVAEVKLGNYRGITKRVHSNNAE
ncbi:hypothetical protein QYF36_018427 [Acer negundo]|nr:hypothetical protein QYF36_018427 [Acer negundo]